jgi:hypothetical protein
MAEKKVPQIVSANQARVSARRPESTETKVVTSSIRLLATGESELQWFLQYVECVSSAFEPRKT